jgi:predicted Rossmann-fold nucleotide-binding protein
MKVSEFNEINIKEIHSLEDFLEQKHSLKNCTIQNLHLAEREIDWDAILIENTTFLGCELKVKDEIKLRKKGAFIFPQPKHLPYNPYRKALYTWQELMEGFSKEKDDSLDVKIYQHFAQTRFNPNINEALYQRIHDHAIDDALRDLLQYNGEGMPIKNCVGIMGGHNIKRTDVFFEKTALTAKMLTEKGYFIASGGGPGIMESANFGAYMGGRSLEDFRNALSILQKAPFFTDSNYMDTSLEVLDKFPHGKDSLAIPTWFYGHEPSNLFATHIAKYFSNSIREDTLLAICLYGIVYAPGSAGTTQEIFMDAAQNHYCTYNYYSPMAFLGTKHYETETLIYPLVKRLAYGKPYYDLLFISDEPEEVVSFLLTHPPLKEKDTF